MTVEPQETGEAITAPAATPMPPKEPTAQEMQVEMQRLTTERDHLREQERMRMTPDERTEAARRELIALQTEHLHLTLLPIKEQLAIEFDLPPALLDWQQGEDEASLRADAQDLAREIAATDTSLESSDLAEQAQSRIYYREELRADPRLAASAEVRQALAEGRIRKGRPPGSASEAHRAVSDKRVYTRSELRANPKLAASAEVRKAAREGRIHEG